MQTNPNDPASPTHSGNPSFQIRGLTKMEVFTLAAMNGMLASGNWPRDRVTALAAKGMAEMQIEELNRVEYPQTPTASPPPWKLQFHRSIDEKHGTATETYFVKKESLEFACSCGQDATWLADRLNRTEATK